MRYIKVWKVLHGDIYLILATQQRPEKKKQKCISCSCYIKLWCVKLSPECQTFTLTFQPFNYRETFIPSHVSQCVSEYEEYSNLF